MKDNASPHKPPRLLPLAEVQHRTGYRTTKLYQLMNTPGAFPRPVRQGRNIRFVESEIDEWITARIAERDATLGEQRALLVAEQEAAAALNVSVSWLQKDRLREQPTVPIVRLGPHIRYDLDAVRKALGIE